MKVRKSLVLGCMTVALCFAATMASAGDVFEGYDVVHDTNGNVVTSTFGYCVHTRWQSNTGECMAKAEPKPVVREPMPEPRVYK